mgnify:CR=1 FL=1
MKETQSGKAEKEHNQMVDRPVLFVRVHISTHVVIKKENPRGSIMSLPFESTRRCRT